MSQISWRGQSPGGTRQSRYPIWRSQTSWRVQRALQSRRDARQTHHPNAKSQTFGGQFSHWIGGVVEDLPFDKVIKISVRAKTPSVGVIPFLPDCFKLTTNNNTFHMSPFSVNTNKKNLIEFADISEFS